MKKIIAILCASVMVAACAGTGGTPSVSPSQIAQTVCPVFKYTVGQFNQISQLMPDNAGVQKAADQLNAVSPIVSSVCSNVSTVSVDNIKDFTNTVLPALASIAGTLPLSPQTLQTVQAGLIMAETALGIVGYVEQEIPKAQAAMAREQADAQ